MLEVIVCLAGIAVLLVLSEWLCHKKVLKGEEQRKFLHITGGIFIAFWPWLISWEAIQLIGAAMLLVVLFNRGSKRKLHFLKSRQDDSYGDVFFALAVILCALLTDQPVFFAIAILQLALADGLAAVIGKKFGKRMRYEVFHQSKTVIGSMSFWFISLCIFGVGVLFVNDVIVFPKYATLLIFGPPIMLLLENISPAGSDNVVLPLAALVLLHAAQTA